MKVSSLHKSVLGLSVFLRAAAALDAVQIWLSGTCQGTSHSWIAIDNGDVTVCQAIADHPADGGLSWVSFAGENRYHLLYTAATCPATAPAVIVYPGGSTTDCVRFPVGSSNHILSVGMLDAVPNVQAANGNVASHSVAGVGVGESPTNVHILFGTRTYLFGDLTLGPSAAHLPTYTDYQAARELLRFTWVGGAPVGTAHHQGRSTDGTAIDYVVQYFNTQGVANPFAQYDNANGNLVPAMLERLYYYMVFNNRCQGSVTLKTNPTTVVMSVGVSFC
ncbi:MAG: hypothetical protein M1839_000660 [Geoglossum umbratile]|nr:MAG: hypothetical protein M1839_000660 [Geoglossum umbratile]